jgi:hypothetical protein
MAAEFNYEDLCAALLCLFFSASLNKTQFAKILEFTAMTSNTLVPKSFNECVNAISKMYVNKTTINKTWYCTSCKNFIILRTQYQRLCIVCGETLSSYIYLPLKNQLSKIIAKNQAVFVNFIFFSR